MIINNRYFVAPPDAAIGFKELFKDQVINGTGRQVGDDGYAVGPWTVELLAHAIALVDANGVGVEVRTVQSWFHNNDRGISHKSIRLLARVFGCGDQKAAGEWTKALSTAKLLTAKNRKKINKNVNADFQSLDEIVSSDVKQLNTKVPAASLWLTKTSKALFSGDSHSSLNLPIIVFCLASVLGLIAYTLNIHSIHFFYEAKGIRKEVGFLWAPNWTIVFWFLLPIYLALVINIVNLWEGNWRHTMIATNKPSKGQITSWDDKISNASKLYWIVLFSTVVISSFFNWTTSHLIPLLNNDLGEWPVSWGRIAILRPDIISVHSAIIFSGAVFIYNAFCAYIFFTGLVFQNMIIEDYLELFSRLKNTSKDRSYQQIQSISINLLGGVFRCMSLGLLITLMMKLQSNFLESEKGNILEWLIRDALFLFDTSVSTENNHNDFRGAPGKLYSFFCVVAIYGTFVVSSIRLRFAFSNFNPSKSVNFFPDRWVAMHVSMVFLVLSYFMIGVFTGFTILLILSVIFTLYLIIEPVLLKLKS